VKLADRALLTPASLLSPENLVIACGNSLINSLFIEECLAVFTVKE
jgi:hypothetical protein